ncbi:MAG: anthrone oxygenase family protein [Jannaschia sp.]
MAKLLGLAGILFAGAMFGFFYAWVTSTMWGLDAADPRIAIAAMQAMNASVRNAAFAPAFFGTAPVLALAALMAWRVGGRTAAGLFGAAALLYLLGGNVLTFAINVPMNEALATVAVPDDPTAAQAIWADYSPRWQVWNQVRMVVCGFVLLLAALGLSRLSDGSRQIAR